MKSKSQILSNTTTGIILMSLFCLSTTYLSAQEASLFNQFHGKKAHKTIKVEEDLYVRFTLEKTITDLAKERGLASSDNIYGIVKMSLANMTTTTGILPLADATTNTLGEFDLIFSVVPKQFQAVTTEKKEEWTNKDNIMLNVLAHPNNTMNNWMKLIAARAVAGQTHEAKIELFLVNNSTSQEAVGKAICATTFKVKVGDNALLPLFGTRIPIMYQPVPDNGIDGDLHQENIGNILWSTQAINSNELDKAKFSTKFVFQKDAIYGRAFLPKSIRNIAAGLGNPKVCAYKVEYSIDEDIHTFAVDKTLDAKSCQNLTSLPIEVFPTQVDQNSNTQLPNEFSKILEQLEAGEHKIKVVLMFYYKDEQAAEPLGLQIADSDFVIMIEQKE